MATIDITEELKLTDSNSTFSTIKTPDSEMTFRHYKTDAIDDELAQFIVKSRDIRLSKTPLEDYHETIKFREGGHSLYENSTMICIVKAYEYTGLKFNHIFVIGSGTKEDRTKYRFNSNHAAHMCGGPSKPSFNNWLMRYITRLRTYFNHKIIIILNKRLTTTNHYINVEDDTEYEYYDMKKK